VIARHAPLPGAARTTAGACLARANSAIYRLQGQGSSAMAIALFVVKATITPEQEEAFNRWYNQEHCPQLLRFPGAVSARRYKAIMGEDRYQYMAVYEFESEDTLQRFLKSDHMAWLRKEYDAHFGDSERQRAAYVQVWP
jgi:antibiotic biosynthesis monooxygenase (ABM) superfamily enzyme